MAPRPMLRRYICEMRSSQQLRVEQMDGWFEHIEIYKTDSHIACVIAHFLSVEQHSLTNIANLISYLIHLIKILWQKS